MKELVQMTRKRDGIFWDRSSGDRYQVQLQKPSTAIFPILAVLSGAPMNWMFVELTK
jgi:hypothetical protein